MNLDNDELAFVEPSATRHDLARRQEGRPPVSDLDERRAESRQQPTHPAEVDAACFAPVPAFNEQLDRSAPFEQRRAPLAWAGGDQQLA